MSALVNLKAPSQDPIKQYIVVLKDSSRYHVAAKCYFLSDYLSYCFCLEDHDVMDSKLRCNKIPKLAFEIAKRDVHAVYETGTIEYFPAKKIKAKITKKPEAKKKKSPIKLKHSSKKA